VIAANRKISQSKYLTNGTHKASIQSIYESLDENLNRVLVIKFENKEGFAALKLPIEMNNKLSLIIGQLGKLGGFIPGTHVKLAMLIGIEYNVTVNNNKIIKIKGT